MCQHSNNLETYWLCHTRILPLSLHKHTHRDPRSPSISLFRRRVLRLASPLGLLHTAFYDFLSLSLSSPCLSSPAHKPHPSYNLQSKSHARCTPESRTTPRRLDTHATLLSRNLSSLSRWSTRRIEQSISRSRQLTCLAQGRRWGKSGFKHNPLPNRLLPIIARVHSTAPAYITKPPAIVRQIHLSARPRTTLKIATTEGNPTWMYAKGGIQTGKIVSGKGRDGRIRRAGSSSTGWRRRCSVRCA